MTDNNGDDESLSSSAIVSLLAGASGAVGVFFGWLDGIGESTVETLTNFAEDPTGFILDIIREWIVVGVLDTWSWLLTNVVGRVFDLLELMIVDGFVIPVRDATVPVGSAVVESVESLQVFGESALVELGLAAPFALGASWLATAIVVAVIVQLAWGFIETYLPVESLTGAVDALRSGVPDAGTGGDPNE